MRTFNTREREIIENLVATKDNRSFDMIDFINKFIYPLEKSEGLYFDFHNKNLYLFLPIEENSDESKVRESINDFYEFLSLIIYLTENRWISIFDSPKPPDFGEDYYLVFGEAFEKDYKRKTIHGFKTSEPPESHDYGWMPTVTKDGQETHRSYELGRPLFSQSAKYFFDEIFISEDLKELVENKFVTREEKRHKEQMRAAWWGIGVAIGSAIVATLIALFSR